ncbi:MAG: ABC transporter ATP-binding protein [Clostridia bacterium]|nr:ABC transporter ATP-binding protein [Clostridia bacterium]
MKLYGPPEKQETLPAFLLKYKPQFVISSLSGILYNTVIVLGPIFLGKLIDAAAASTAELVWMSALYYVGITAFFQLARFIKRWFMRDQFNRVACDLRQTMTDRVLERSVPELSHETTGDLMSRTVGDITLVVDTVMSTLNEGWDTWLLMLSYFVALMFMDWKVTLIASIMVPITVILAQSMRHLLYRYSLAVRQTASRANTGLLRYLDGIYVLRLFGREKSEAGKINDAFEDQASYSIKEIVLQQAVLPVYALIAGLGIVVAIGLLGQRVAAGDLSIGSFNAYIIMFVAFSGRTKVAARVFNRWHGAKAAWVRVKEKMASKPATKNQNIDTIVACSNLSVSNLIFGYEETSIIHNISFEAEKGQIIGITGPVGCGKTSLAKALTGLYPYEGHISLDGYELRELSSESRRRLIAYTGHEQFLFSMSIKDNLLLGEKEDTVRLQSALDGAALSGDLSRFENGLKTTVGEKGVRVSGGQRQRIALARAIYADSDILLLDDPFSAVDIATEREIISLLRKTWGNKIILLFTHRLTAFPYVDRVLVMENGRITEQGNHAELMEMRGLYQKIYAAQEFMEVKEK